MNEYIFNCDLETFIRFLRNYERAKGRGYLLTHTNINRDHFIVPFTIPVDVRIEFDVRTLGVETIEVKPTVARGNLVEEAEEFFDELTEALIGRFGHRLTALEYEYMKVVKELRRESVAVRRAAVAARLADRGYLNRNGEAYTVTTMSRIKRKLKEYGFVV